MSRTYTTDGLINSVKRRCGVPINQATFTRAAILALADDSMLDLVIPMIRRHSNDHFVTYSDTTTTTATSYDIPTEAMNRGVYDVAILDGSSNPVSLIPIDQTRERHNAGALFGRRGYYVEGDQLVIYPDCTSGQTLRIYYERLPNRLCLSAAYTNPTETAECGIITGISSGTITCSAGVPSTISTSTPICAIDHTPGFTLQFSNVTPSGKTGTTVTTTSANAALCAVGNYIALEGDSPIVQLPVEAHPILAQAVAVKCLEAMGDEYITVAQDRLGQAISAYEDSFKSRTKTQPKRVFSRNRLADYLRS